MDRPANESFQYTAVIDKIPGLYNGVDNRLMKLTLTFDQGMNDKYGITPKNQYILIDSVYDGLPSFLINTTNTTFCPDWFGQGVCTYYFEVNKTYADSSVRSEQIIVLSIDMPYYTASVNLYNPPKIISYASQLSANNTISVGEEANNVMGYIRNYFTFGFEILTIMFWLFLIILLLVTLALVFMVINYIYSWLRRTLG